MELQIYTKIIKLESNYITNRLEIINYIAGNSIDTNNFEIIDIKTIDFRITNSRTITPINIFNLLQISKEDCSFLHIQCKNSDDTVITNNIKMTLSFGGQVFNCSQLTLANVSDFNSDIIVTDVIVPTDNVGTLTIVAGVKEEDNSTI